jgi:hypothetical protein
VENCAVEWLASFSLPVVRKSLLKILLENNYRKKLLQFLQTFGDSFVGAQVFGR